jgi:hypothetical protein
MIFREVTKKSAVGFKIIFASRKLENKTLLLFTLDKGKTL